MKAQTARRLRQLHRLIALFFTPAILFFAFSGALQTLGLHEDHSGKTQPPAWIEWMAGIHKDQRAPVSHEAERPAPHADDARPAAPARHEHHEEAEGPSAVPMKIFVILLSIGLIGTSLLGCAIAVTSPATRKSAWIALALGTIVPVLLIFV